MIDQDTLMLDITPPQENGHRPMTAPP